MTKGEVRQIAKRVRADIPPEKRQKKSAIIAKKFFDLKLTSSAQKICIYMPIGSEVDTREIAKKLLEQNKQVYAPVVVSESEMVAVRLNSLDEVKIGAFNIPEPQGEMINAENLDLIIVPMVAFNRQRSRIGYGKGYYDRFLPNGVRTVGLAYLEQNFDFLPDAHDKTLDLIITDEEIF